MNNVFWIRMHRGKEKLNEWKLKKKEEFMISGFNQEGDIESIVLKYEEL